MIKRLDKKGQEGMTMGTFLGLILGVIGVVLIGYGIYTYYNTVISPTNVDVDLVLMEQSCTNFLSAGSTQYCVGKFEVSSNTYIGCVYAKNELGMKIDESKVEIPTNCGAAADIGKQICTKVQVEKGADFDGDKVYVNNQKCSDGFEVGVADKEEDEDSAEEVDVVDIANGEVA